MMILNMMLGLNTGRLWGGYFFDTTRLAKLIIWTSDEAWQR